MNIFLKLFVIGSVFFPCGISRRNAININIIRLVGNTTVKRPSILVLCFEMFFRLPTGRYTI